MSSYAASATGTSGLGSVLSPNNVSEASTFAKERATEFRNNLNEGSWSLRFMALIGALAMMVVSVLGFMGDIVMLKWISAIFEIYTFLLGVIIIILEYGRQLTFFAKWEATLYKNALFLKYVWGRGLLYFVAGTLTISLRNLVDVVIGVYVCFVGITFILIGRSTASKLSNVRREAVSPAQLQEMFAIADVDGKGALSTEQFHGLTKQLGMDLTKREVESAFLQLDCESRGRVSYETILMWWNNEASEQDDFQATVL